MSEDATDTQSLSYWSIVFVQFKKRRMAVASLGLLCCLFLVAILAPFLAGDRPIYLRMNDKSYVLPNVFQYKDLVDVQFDRWEPAEGDYVLKPLIPYTPRRTNLREKLEEPGKEHLLGTDNVGRDVFSRIIWGTRISISVGFIAVGIAIILGIIMGAAAGYYGGKVDMVSMAKITVK